jgi:hypothetical protein
MSSGAWLGRRRRDDANQRRSHATEHQETPAHQK